MAGKIIAVVGGKGGVGKSLFSANLAIAYQQEFKVRPLIVDMDLSSFGDQNIILGAKHQKNIVDASKAPGTLSDMRALQPFLTSVQGGMSFVGAPTDPHQDADCDVAGLSKFLKAVQKHFEFIVVDCGSQMSPAVMQVFENSTAIFVVTTADVMVINQTKKALSKIRELLFPNEMVQVILNRYSKNSLIKPQIVQQNLGKPIFGYIPEDIGSCDSSLAKRQPLFLSYPQSVAANGFRELVRKLRQSRMLEQLETIKKPSGISQKLLQERERQFNKNSESAGRDVFGRSKSAELDSWTAMRLRIHKALVEKMDLKKMDSGQSSEKELKALKDKTRTAVLDIIQAEDSALLSSRDLKSQMVKEVIDEALGLGPLEDLLTDKSVTEIMVNARDQIYVERNGRLTMSPVTFSSEQQMMNVVERIVTPIGRRVDEKVPFVDARLADGSRVHIIIPPLALRGPTITIRKFPEKRIVVKDLIDYGSMTEEIADFLRVCVEASLNIVVSGGTGSGKTTLLNVLSNFIPSSERIITVEDSAELQLGQEHVVRLESRPESIEGGGAVTIRDLVKNCLRMRPNRIIVGECRGGEALDMLSAMSTGHSGSMTTVHANNPKDSVSRLELLASMSDVELEARAIRETIASAVDLIVQQSRLPDGSRKITHITEVVGMTGDVVTLQDIFQFKQEGIDKKRRIIGRYVPTGLVPRFVETMEKKGMKISRKLFSPKEAA